MKVKVTDKFKTFLMLNIKQECLDEILEKIYQYHEIDAGSINIPAEVTRNNVEFVLFPEDQYFVEIPEYNPNNWNNYPEVTPPKPGYYRVESNRNNPYVAYKVKAHRKECWIWTGTHWEWVNAPGRVVNTACHENIKFKPWDN